MATLAKGSNGAHIDDPYIDVVVIYEFDENVARLDVAVNNGDPLVVEFVENGECFD